VIDWKVLNFRVNKYGLTAIEYSWLLSYQGERCAICNYLPLQNERPLAIDHDHKTKKVRGLVCDRCNSHIELYPKRREIYQYLHPDIQGPYFRS